MNGRNFSSENVTLALREAHQVRDYLKNDTADEERVTSLGAIFEEESIAPAISKMYFGSFPASLVTYVRLAHVAVRMFDPATRPSRV